MIKVIAETAMHHEGDFNFMQDLIKVLSKESCVDVIKMHISLDFDEYMSKNHKLYGIAKSWLFSEAQWEILLKIVKRSEKKLMLLLNDTKAINFAAQFSPDFVELHSVCVNVPALQNSILEKIDKKAKIVIGIGGCTIEEIDSAINSFQDREVVIMTGFQNFPTKYEDVNLDKIRKIQTIYADKEFGYADHTAWDEKNNELITLLVASNGMNYVEKHITLAYGESRCDYSAAISLDMIKSLAEKLKVLSLIRGNGSLLLNSGEEQYSKYGPMKMAAVLVKNIKKGCFLLENSYRFCRTSEETNLSQINVVNSIGKIAYRDLSVGQVLKKEDLV
jgi:sialic acid synthase SpsE